MPQPSQTQLRKNIKTWIVTFIIFLAFSGITAFPVETELVFVMKIYLFCLDFYKAGSLQFTMPLKPQTSNFLTLPMERIGLPLRTWL